MSKQPVSILAFLGWLVLFEAVLVGIIVLVCSYAPTVQGPVITTVALLGLLAICRAAFKLLWNRMLMDYPPQEVPAHAKSKSFQSFSFGSVNMGLSINAAADDTYLHIEPILPWRLLGASSASIPFDAMEPLTKHKAVRVGKWTMAGPKWCLENAHKPPKTADFAQSE
ncbi:MAG: hypothetical protein QGI75_05960 [Phycisphaerales bacterium]|nr:hypothetical protein [Phycisphaerales bacterium]MDP6890382.1 hypothetical protein [Phycisphaerales bacterium]